MYCKDEGYRKLPSVVTLCSYHNINEEAPLESPKQSSPSASATCIRPCTSCTSETEFETVVSCTGTSFPNSVLTCKSPNLSPISSLTTERDLDEMPEGLDFLSDLNEHTGILLPGIQYQSYNEIYTVSLGDGTSTTFHRTLYIPIRVQPVNRRNFARRLLPHYGPLDSVSPQMPACNMDGDQNTWLSDSTNSVDNNESFPVPERENQPLVSECHVSKEDTPAEDHGRDENNQVYCASLEITLGDFERTMTSFSLDSESANSSSRGVPTTSTGERPNLDFFNPK